MLDATVAPTLLKNITSHLSDSYKSRIISHFIWDYSQSFSASSGRCDCVLPTITNLHNMLESVARNVLYLSILVVSQLVSQVITADERFIVPSNESRSLSYREGSFLTLAWNTTLDRIALTLWQDGINALEYIGALSCNQPCHSSCTLT